MTTYLAFSAGVVAFVQSGCGTTIRQFLDPRPAISTVFEGLLCRGTVIVYSRRSIFPIFLSSFTKLALYIFSQSSTALL
jgi:hypothetical protein